MQYTNDLKEINDGNKNVNENKLTCIAILQTH